MFFDGFLAFYVRFPDRLLFVGQEEQRNVLYDTTAQLYGLPREDGMRVFIAAQLAEMLAGALTTTVLGSESREKGGETSGSERCEVVLTWVAGKRSP